MLRSLYSGVSGMKGFQTKLDVIGNNIANVNTVGFKTGRVMFQDILSQTIAGVTAPVAGVQGGVNPKQIGLGVSIAAIDTLHTPGSGMTTNVITDLSIEGDGYFLVSPTGTIDDAYLTRAGNFTRDAYGNLVTSQGFFVLSSGGEPINIPAEVVSFSIGKDGDIYTTDATGVTTQMGTPVGIVKVMNPAGLKKVGNTMYQMTLNANPDGGILLDAPGVEGRGKIISGQLEMSNVDLTSEFTEMIVAQRGFQSNSKIITTSDEILQELVNLKR